MKACRYRWCSTGLMLLCLFLAGCAATLPTQKPPAQVARAQATEGVLAEVERRIAAVHPPEVSGFHLLERNTDGLTWRLALIENARDSIDLQYYVWFGDLSGQLLLSRVIAAADRGVRVRILFDDLNTMLRRMTSPELRDAMLARVDQHPRIEIRVFNGWHSRDWIGRVVEGTTDFERLNRRMHNKQMVVDNRAAIIGGRNIGDEYMGLDAEFNFHDLDVLGIGPVARQASAVFDRYWNSDWVRRLPQVAAQGSAAIAAEVAELPAEALRDPTIQRLVFDVADRADKLQRLPQDMAFGTSVVHTDSPSRASNARNRMPEAFRDLMRSAKQEVVIVNAYLIPDQTFIDDLRDLANRKVKVRILTNSLASHDVPAVNAHYERWRRPILATGAELFELRPDPAMQASVVDTPPIRSGFVGLHTKAMVIDRSKAFIGSMNLDPRSEIYNSEMGVVVTSPQLAEQLARSTQRDMDPSNSWQVKQGADGRLVWIGAQEQRYRQPARTAWQRVQNLFFKLAPASYY